jgi:hypothetical protein
MPSSSIDMNPSDGCNVPTAAAHPEAGSGYSILEYINNKAEDPVDFALRPGTHLQSLAAALIKVEAQIPDTPGFRLNERFPELEALSMEEMIQRTWAREGAPVEQQTLATQ